VGGDDDNDPSAEGNAGGDDPATGAAAQRRLFRNRPVAMTFRWKSKRHPASAGAGPFQRNARLGREWSQGTLQA
jgi:hypothetical protein